MTAPSGGKKRVSCHMLGEPVPEVMKTRTLTFLKQRCVLAVYINNASTHGMSLGYVQNGIFWHAVTKKARAYSHEVNEARGRVMKYRGKLQWALLHDYGESVEGARLET